jgi:hypothetical protein
MFAVIKREKGSKKQIEVFKSLQDAITAIEGLIKTNPADYTITMLQSLNLPHNYEEEWEEEWEKTQDREILEQQDKYDCISWW